MQQTETSANRTAPFNLSCDDFRSAGHHLVDRIADFFDSLPLRRLQQGGEASLSNAVIGGIYALRACIVNFRTTLQDVEALLPVIVRIGRQVDAAIRPSSFA